MNCPNCPEIIAHIDRIDTAGNDESLGDKIIGVQVRQTKNQRDGTLDIDIRNLDRKTGNLVIRIPLPELMAAISCATLNSDREDA